LRLVFLLKLSLIPRIFLRLPGVGIIVAMEYGMIFLKMTASRYYRCNQAYFIPDIPGVGIIVATLGIKIT